MLINPIDSIKVNLIRRAHVMRFYLRRASLSAVGSGGLSNVYYCTMQKCGSQWVSGIFSDPRIQNITGLAVYPQHHYDVNDFKVHFPVRAFIAGLYIDYPLYELFIRKTSQYRTFFVYRDPRDVVVSWYWSAKETHGENWVIKKHRERLNAMSLEEGITYAILNLSPKLMAMRTWIEMGADDPNVLLIKFEDMVSQTESVLVTLMEFLGYDCPACVLGDVVGDYTKARMRDREKNVGQESHYRKQSSSHKGVFNDYHYRLFDELTGNMVSRMGY